eukprot:TRINITY_DN7033_c0_g1_i1.p1 TRINITY_DN7033_c0_g1~~TRINITY_DN7033_c0_g1_i1.p1  ORF type:complete len:143 (+),score=3.03 TRINITY_DN7033_c0_g1_i1:71-499(+)
MMCMMPMWFSSGTQLTIVFEGWKTETVWQYALSCIAVIILSACYEFIVTLKYNIAVHSKVKVDEEETHGLINGMSVRKNSLLNSTHIKITLMHILQITLSYFLMLVVMTYNVGLFISCITGYGLGFFLFGSQRAKEPASCHV